MPEEIKPASMPETKSGPVTSTEIVPEKKPEVSLLDEARAVRDDITKSLASITEERKKIEKAAAELLVGGRSFGGQQQKPETEDEKWKRDAKSRYAGTGLDPT